MQTRAQQSIATNQNERKIMNDKFDELAKGLAQSVTRRGALKKFGAGLVGIALPGLDWRTALKPRHSTANAINPIMDAVPLVLR
jgi:hypothetical protein